MNSLELKGIIRQDNILSKSFAGIYAKDQLNWTVKKRPSSLIANTDASGMPGQHWVAMYFDKNGSADYFDSYGMQPYVPEFIKFLKRNSVSQNYNNKHLQSADSYVCGVYCVYFLYHRARHMSMPVIMKHFSIKKFLYNDRLVCQFLYKRFHYCHRVCCRKPQAIGLA